MIVSCNENNDLVDLIAERWNSIAIGQTAANITYKGQLGKRQINR